GVVENDPVVAGRDADGNAGAPGERIAGWPGEERVQILAETARLLPLGIAGSLRFWPVRDREIRRVQDQGRLAAHMRSGRSAATGQHNHVNVAAWIPQRIFVTSVGVATPSERARKLLLRSRVPCSSLAAALPRPRRRRPCVPPTGPIASTIHRMDG